MNNEPEAYQTPDEYDAAPDEPNREGMPDAAPAPRRPREVGAVYSFPAPTSPTSINPSPMQHQEQGRAPEAGARPAVGEVPRYLRSLADAGALEMAELGQVKHRQAYVEFAGERGEGKIPLAHLAPDAVSTLARRAGSGHVTGTIYSPGLEPLNFALVIEAGDDAQADATPADPRLAALEAHIARLEKALTQKSPIQKMGEEWVMDALAKAMNPPPAPDPMQMMEQAVKQVKQLAGMAGTIKDKLGPLAEILAPAVTAHVDPEQAPGVLAKLLDKGVEWALQPGNIMRAVSMFKGELVADETFVDVDGAPVE